MILDYPRHTFRSGSLHSVSICSQRGTNLFCIFFWMKQNEVVSTTNYYITTITPIHATTSRPRASHSCQYSNIHATTSRPRASHSCQYSNIHATTSRPRASHSCQYSNIHATTSRPRASHSCQYSNIHATTSRPILVSLLTF